MSSLEWIVCERSGHWTAALRTALAREYRPGQSTPRVVDVRQLGEVSQRLNTHPDGLALVEVHRANVGPMLAWLAEASCRHPRARYVALLDRDIVATAPPAGDTNASLRRLADALREAGASDIVASPRRLASFLAWARRHAQRQPAPAGPTADISPIDWAWSSLPWQDK